MPLTTPSTTPAAGCLKSQQAEQALAGSVTVQLYRGPVTISNAIGDRSPAVPEQAALHFKKQPQQCIPMAIPVSLNTVQPPRVAPCHLSPPPTRNSQRPIRCSTHLTPKGRLS